MAQPTKPSIWYAFRSCYRKQKFESVKAANKQIRRVLRQYNVQLYAYDCHNCGSIHLTKNKHHTDAI